MQQLRYAVRLLTKNPGFTAAAIACLALGIGATTAIFSVVNAVVFRPLPYAKPEQLVRVFTEFVGGNNDLRHFWVSGPEFLELKRDTKAWNGFELWFNQGVNLAGTADPIRVTASFMSWGMLPMLGVTPILGRTFNQEEDRPGVPYTAVLSYALWQRAYGGDRGIIGRDIRMNGVACTVVGVMPPGFAFPPGELDPPELWLPMRLDPAQPGGRGGHNFSVLARLKEGTSLAAAKSEIQRYLVTMEQTSGAAQGHFFNTRNHTVVLAGLQDEVVSGVKQAMLVLLGAVAFVLLIACVNVANLLLARSEARRREIAVRTAIGAGMGTLLRQFMVEGLLLSLSGAALGILLAFGGLRGLVAANSASIPRSGEINIDWQVLLFTLAVSVVTGMTFGLAPIIHMRASALHDTLKAAAGRSTSTVMANRFRAALVTSELALALVLLIGSGLMVKAFWKLMEVNSGVDARNLLTLRFSLPAATYRDLPSIVNFQQMVTARVESLPGVASAAMVSGLPPGRPINANTTLIEGAAPLSARQQAAEGQFDEIDYYNNVGWRYFETVGARLIDGRFFSEGDGASANPVVIVNQAMARKYWPNGSAIGHRVRNGGPTSPWRTIVGVVTDIKNAGLDRPAGTELYFPIAQAPSRLAYLFVKTRTDPQTLVNAVRSEIHGLDRALPIANIRTMEDVLDSARARPRFLTLLLTLFSSIALLLAALGIYGVISYSVAQRTNEIGIRMALGAQRGDVVRLVGKTGLRLALAGTVLGAIGAFALTRTMSGMLFGVSSFDVGTFAAMAGALIGVTMLACWMPARRASRVDPLVALRYE